MWETQIMQVTIAHKKKMEFSTFVLTLEVALA